MLPFAKVGICIEELLVVSMFTQEKYVLQDWCRNRICMPDV